jgi:hypothetical protein
LTTAVDALPWLEAGGLLALLEEDPEPLLPHAASVKEEASAGRRNFKVGRIGTPSHPCDENDTCRLKGAVVP